MNRGKGEIIFSQKIYEQGSKRITMKTHIEKLYDSGIQEIFETPISTEDDFKLHYCVIKKDIQIRYMKEKNI